MEGSLADHSGVMLNSQDGSPEEPFQGTIDSVLRSTEATASEQLSAAWQLHVDRVEQELKAGWNDHIQHVLGEIFKDIASNLVPELERKVQSEAMAALESRLVSERAEWETRLQCEKRQACRDLAGKLNQSGRRLRQAAEQSEWEAALLDGATAFCARAALLRLEGEKLRFAGAVVDGSNDRQDASPPLELTLREAPAFASANESDERLAVVCGDAELSQALRERLGPGYGERVYLWPVKEAGRTRAILVTEADESRIDSQALDQLILLASMPPSRIVGPQAGPTAAAQTAAAPLRTVQPDWSSLSREEQDLHLQAQRFARVQVAEMRLYKSQEVKEGRARKNLYSFLKEEIDRGRAAYSDRFMKAAPSMIDYLHAELVRTLANQDITLLGEEYPGPLA